MLETVGDEQSFQGSILPQAYAGPLIFSCMKKIVKICSKQYTNVKLHALWTQSITNGEHARERESHS